MLTGACAGSTAGGLKMSRVMLMFKNIFRSIKQLVMPRSVNVVRQEGEVIPERTLHATANYVTIYFVMIVFMTLLVSLDGFDFETNISAVLACINNIGPGFSVVGPVGNFAGFSYFSKIVLTFTMLAGRLELLPIFILFSPTLWKKN